MAKTKNTIISRITEGGTIATTLGKETSFQGVLEFKKPLQINGLFEGEIITDGILIIGPGAVVKANIEANIVIVGGEVIGNITAYKMLEMLESGKVTGNIKTAKLQIADGVIFDGNCEMLNNQKSKSSLNASE